MSAYLSVRGDEGGESHVEQHVSSGRDSYVAAGDIVIYRGGSAAFGAPGPPGDLPEDIESPYKGLNAFGEDDASLFFGREKIAEKIRDRLHAGKTSLLIVSGDSGAGKSSLVRAGVVPWFPGPRLVITPGRMPLDQLAAAVAGLTEASLTEAERIRDVLGRDPGRFALIARRAADRGPGSGSPDRAGRRLLLVVDQFEELFTQCEDEGERRSFIAALHAAVTEPFGPEKVPAAWVILVMRAEFETRCTYYEELQDAVDSHHMLPQMNEVQLRLAITGPARLAGGSVDSELVDLLVREVGPPGSAFHLTGLRAGAAGGPEKLPLLSYALDQAWRGKTSQALGLADYERTGGMRGSIGASAEQAYETLLPRQREVARQVFIRLTTTTPDGGIVAARCRRADLEASGDAAAVQAVLDAFAGEQARLLTVGASSVAISHEALLTAWDKLEEWLRGDEDDRKLHSRLLADARVWADGKRDPYSAARVEEIDDAIPRWASVPGRYPLDKADAFLAASRHAARRARTLRRRVLAVLSALTAAALAAAGFVWYFAANASTEHEIALSRQLAAESLAIDDTAPVVARQLAVAAWRIFPTSQATSAMTTLADEQQQDGMIFDDPSGVASVSFSPDGRLLATEDGDRIVRVRDLTDGRQVLMFVSGNGNGRSAHGMAFSPDGRLLATAGAGDVQIWNPVTGRQVRDLPRGGGDITQLTEGVAFSPDGQVVAAAIDGTVQFWNAATGRSVGPPRAAVPLGSVPDAIAYSPDGTVLATATSSGIIGLWDPATGTKVRDWRASDGAAPSLAFSPDGTLLATATSNGIIGLWDPATGTKVRDWRASDGAAPSLAFSPDGTLLATGGSDGIIRLWNPATGQPAGPPLDDSSILSGGSQITDVSWARRSPEGQVLGAINAAGVVRLWQVPADIQIGDPLLVNPAGQSFTGGQIAFSPDGTLLAGAIGGQTELWNLRTRQQIGTPVQGGSDHQVIAFSPRQELLAIASGSSLPREVSFLNAATARSEGIPIEPAGVGSYVTTMAFSPDGNHLAVGYADGTLQVSDVALFASAYETLCADVGPPTRQTWDQYAAGEPQPAVCG